MSVYRTPMKDQIITFKILLIGCSGRLVDNLGVGKSSLLLKYIKNTFSYDYNVTTGIEFFSKVVKINQRITIKLQIWDTVGQQAFKSVVRSFYKGVAAIILMYSIDKQQSFDQLSSWMHEIKQNSHQQSMIYVVGTKLDLQQIRKVSKISGNQYSKSINGEFIEVSSKTGENIKELFEKVSKGVYKKFQISSSFRNLVKPIFQENLMSKKQSFQLQKSKHSFIKRNKNCCQINR